MRTAAALALAIGLLGCTALEPGDVVRGSDGGVGPRDANVGMDSSVPMLDAAPADGGDDLDASAPPDAGDLDGGVPVVGRVAAGGRHTCAIVGATRELVCWGARDRGQLGPMAPDGRGPFRTGILGVRDVCAGDDFTCTVRPIGGGAQRVACFGANDDGQLGPAAPGGDGGMSLMAVRVGEWPMPVDVECGARHACALDGTGTLRCWGDNREDQVQRGLGGTVTVTEITDLPGTPTAVSLGDGHSCALTDDGGELPVAYCWGRSTATGGAGLTFVADAATHVAAGGDYSCTADTTTAGLGCVGDDTTGGRSDFLTFAQGLDLELEHLVAGEAYTCAASRNRLVCWGLANVGQIGEVSPSPSIHDWLLTEDEGLVVDLSAGRAHGCVVTNDGVLRCWGSNGEGQVTGTPTPGAGVDRTIVSLAGI